MFTAKLEGKRPNSQDMLHAVQQRDTIGSFKILSYYKMAYYNMADEEVFESGWVRWVSAFTKPRSIREEIVYQMHDFLV